MIEAPVQLQTQAYAATNAQHPLSPFSFTRRAVGPKDVLIEILYCGVCHSDIHQVRNEWGNSIYPMVPGHEIIGKVIQTGESVQRYQPGDRVGVGCLVDSCRTCDPCKKGLEQYCEKGSSATYNSMEQDGKTPTYGGYASKIVVHEDFVLKIPENLDLAAAAPLLCAGITTYSPLKHWNVGPGQKVGIIGLGGLGHMGVKFAHALGAHTVVVTSSANKKEAALQLGADDIIVSKNMEELRTHAKSFDFLLSTVSAPYDINTYLNLLKLDGTMVLVGAPEEPLPTNVFSLIMQRRSIAGSLIGGLPETQEMLDFCGEHHLVAEVEIIPIQQVNEAYERMLRSDVRYRFVIDLKSLPENE